MSDIKPIVSEETVQDIVKQHLNEPADNLELIKGGSVAQAFTFIAKGQEYVIRFNTNKMGANYEKEAFIIQNFASDSVPIPTIIQIGYTESLCYCISEKAIGERLDQLSPEEIQRTLPSLIETLDAIHLTNVSGQSGYGLFSDQGQGFFSSWPAYLRSC